MISRESTKENISIKHIGRQRFWLGILAGIITAVALSLWFNYGRETYRLMTSLDADLMTLPKHEVLFFNYFFSALSTVLGFSMTIWMWMNNTKHKHKRDRLNKRYTQINSMLIFWIILLVLVRFGTILPFLLFGTRGYDNHLNLYEDYWILFVLLPIVIFMQNWTPVRLIYRSKKWMLLSFLFCIATTITLTYTTSIDQGIINEIYYNRYQKDYLYIDNEINKANNNYGITYDKTCIEVLKKWHTERSVDQLMHIKTAFAKHQKVSLDTIILQKIMIRNCKQGYYVCGNRYYIENWHYALPNDILRQIQYNSITSHETKELFEMLKEEIDLVNTALIDYNDFDSFTETEKRRSRMATYQIPYLVINQLIKVRNILLTDDRYVMFAKDLPEIKVENIEKPD